MNRDTRSCPSVEEPRDAGQIMVLTIGYALLALALVLVLASASAVHLERKQLLALADAAALDAADALDGALYYSGVDLPVLPGDAGADAAGVADVVVPLTDESVRAAVVEHVERSPAAGGVTGLQIGEPTGTSDGVTAQVTLTGVARLPFVPWAIEVWSGGIPLRVTSSARAG